MSTVTLSAWDKRLLAGEEGAARQTAMKIMVRMAEIQGAKRFIDVTRAHVDGCIYTGEASLKFTETLVNQGGQVRIPTTMNAISLDRQRWRQQGLDAEWAGKADRLAMAYVDMGVQPTFTCAPYHLPNPPAFGEQIAWAESNAVVYANSVIGARTNRYGDFMDIFAGLTGRVPYAGYHTDEARRATVVVRLPDLQGIDASFYPVLGYLIGSRLDGKVAVVTNLVNDGNSRPGDDDLRALGAAGATAGSIGLFHIEGVTPEAGTVEEALHHQAPDEVWNVTIDELAEVWRELSSAKANKVDLVALGNPHFSVEECNTLAALVQGRKRFKDVHMYITTSRYVYEQATESGAAQVIEAFGAGFITDTCWCMLNTPVIPETAATLMTNSGKYAHYAPGLTGRAVYFGSLEDCVRSAITGTPHTSVPTWLGR